MLGVVGLVVTRLSVEGVATPGQVQAVPSRRGVAVVGLYSVQLFVGPGSNSRLGADRHAGRGRGERHVRVHTIRPP